MNQLYFCKSHKIMRLQQTSEQTLRRATVKV